MATITPATASGAVVALGGGIESLPILERIRALGHRLIVVDASPSAPGLRLADVPILASCYDAAAALAALDAAEVQSDAVLCAATDTPHVAAAIAEGYDLPGLTRAEARLSVDKLAQKRALRLAGLPVPEFCELFTDFPVPPAHMTVFKPANSRGARGVRRIRDVSEIDAAFAAARAASPTGRVMVEQWLDGRQLSTESIVQGGRVLFTAVALRNYARLAEFAPYVIEDGVDNWIVTDGTLNRDALLAEIDTLLGRACAALGWDNLTVKGDLVLHAGKLYIIELAARLSGGFLCTHTIPLAYGVPFVDYAIRLALGETVEAPKAEHRQFVCQRYVFPDISGIGRRVAGVYHVPTAAEFATLAVKPGDVIQPVTSHANRLGQAICVGASPDEARARAEQAVAALKRGIVLE